MGMNSAPNPRPMIPTRIGLSLAMVRSPVTARAFLKEQGRRGVRRAVAAGSPRVPLDTCEVLCRIVGREVEGKHQGRTTIHGEHYWL